MRRIVVATAADVDQPRVLDAAAQLATETEAEVTVVSADDVESQRYEALPRSELLEQARDRAAAAVERLDADGVRARMEVRPGPAAEVIAQVAEELDADLIVVGASRRPALAERLLGSVPVELMQRSGRQVLVVADSG